ncbi:class I SAM-dependent methyltransferase [Chamaesiphon sp. VAR_69_metabat_338]|uniref:class I SAM-dependent methyltransferase n=1 Tax=Chamaesiphon sp. VAR_69_metabat_338 TaxID=2964704 RepID=UPI00286D9E0D|nr:class I SAM-dependent methyltransferase [Chamaesiphon sp. VAR_69_metabat_338]
MLESTTAPRSMLSEYLAPDARIDTADRVLPPELQATMGNCPLPAIPASPIAGWSPGMLANASFFGDPEFGLKYFQLENSSAAFGRRWQAAIRQGRRCANGNWDGKIVIDVGCGPGNLYAAVGGTPRSLLGIDISHGALVHAQQLGYTPLLADAHDLPLRDGCADIVTLNAVLHHCDDMARVLAEAARLVRPGGLLITDEDPLVNTVSYRGLAWLVTKARERFPLYWLPGRAAVYKTPYEQAWRQATEIHNSKPGDGVTPALYLDTLEPLGFSVELYPHHHNVGAELFCGDPGRLGFKDRSIQLLARENAPPPPQSIACIARKHLASLN